MMRTSFFIVSLLFSVFAKAELTIEITQGIATSIPISVVPFQTESLASPGAVVDKVVASDLERSGHFSVLAPKDMLSHPHTEDDLYFRDWRLLKQDYVVMGLSLNYLKVCFRCATSCLMSLMNANYLPRP